MVTYGNKGYRIWGRNHRKDIGKAKGQIGRDVHVKTDVLNISCHLYCFNYCYFPTGIYQLTLLYLFIGCLFDKLFPSPLHVCGV